MPSLGILISILFTVFNLVSAQLATEEDCLSAGLSACWCSCSVPTLNAYCEIGSTAVAAEQCACTNANAWAQLLSCATNAGCANIANYEQLNSVACAKLGYSLATPAATQNVVETTLIGTTPTNTVATMSGLTVTNTVPQTVGSSTVATTRITVTSGADSHLRSVGVLTIAFGFIAVLGHILGTHLPFQGPSRA
jgi:hypothetical protein